MEPLNRRCRWPVYQSACGKQTAIFEHVQTTNNTLPTKFTSLFNIKRRLGCLPRVLHMVVGHLFGVRSYVCNVNRIWYTGFWLFRGPAIQAMGGRRTSAQYRTSSTPTLLRYLTPFQVQYYIKKSQISPFVQTTPAPKGNCKTLYKLHYGKLLGTLHRSSEFRQ